MKVVSATLKTSDTPVKTIDTFVDDGYLQGEGGSLPDVDNDFQSDKRPEVKEYTERRYNKNGLQRVFSAGTYTTLKSKACLKDVARTMRIPTSIVNYITAIIDDDKCDYTGLFKLAATNKKVAKFIGDHPQLFEDVRTLMFQPRSSSVHASALLITPDTKDGETMECFDYVPIKKVDGILVSENDGYELDELGLLKNDCLATKELSKIHQTLDLVNTVYHQDITLEKLATGSLDDEKVYEVLANGCTQNVFQFSSHGITKFLTEMKPSNIGDLIAANALYRPATMGNLDDYVNCKKGLVAPVYLWGTYNSLKDTFGLVVFQEQIVMMAREVGGFSLGEGVKLVKFVSKKKTDKIRAMKDKFMAGAKKNGCPQEDADKIWAQIEAAGTYCFNKCISGKERIRRSNRTSGGLTIAEMYKVMNDRAWAVAHGHKSLHDRYRRVGYGKGWSLVHTDGYDEYLLKNDIVDIRYMGIRPLYRITLEDGRTIDVTDNHKHPTNNGMKRTDELQVGVDKMYVNIGSLSEDTVYRFTDKGSSNDTYYHSNDNVQQYELNSEKGHCGFTKRDTNYTLLEKYRKEQMKSHCEKCGKSDCRLEIHHINGDHSVIGDNYSNLQTLCSSCHKKAHYAMGRAKQGEKGLYTELRAVVSVEYIGDDEVYDVEMADPYHTFTTEQGVVTCNSHATAYAVTAYAGAWLKVHYPTAFYTVALQWADDNELVALMGEMEAISNAKVVPPDINVSEDIFHTDYNTNEIFWSISRIKQLGAKAVQWIMDERKKNGEFTSITNFIDRIFKYKLKKYEYWDDPNNEEEATRCPVNARCVLNLILAGCFDKVEHAGSVIERYAIIEKAAEQLGFEIKEKDIPMDMRGKHYFWSQQQVKVSGIGSVDYKRIYDNSAIKPQLKGRVSYATLQSIIPNEMDGKKVGVCATVVEVEEKKFKSKKTGGEETFCKLLLQQNNDLCECIVWPEEYKSMRPQLIDSKNKLIIFSATVKYSDYAGKNNLQFMKRSLLEVL